jgi:hypothetical protein
MPHSQLPSPVLSLSLRGLAGMEVSPHPASAYYWLAPAFDLSFSPFPSGFRVNPQSPSPYVIHDIQVQVYNKVTKKTTHLLQKKGNQPLKHTVPTLSLVGRICLCSLQLTR